MKAKKPKLNYDIVLDAIPYWKPTYWVQSFDVTAVQRIVKCDLQEAVDIVERLHYEGAFPTAKW